MACKHCPMATLDSILNSIPISDVAEKLGVSDEVATQAISEASSVLVAGLAKNATTPKGAEALQDALKKHEGFQGVQSTGDIDTEDGQKILNHIFGDKTPEVAAALSEEPATAGIDFSKLLPALAPILMGVLGAHQANNNSGGGIGDVLGGLLGGGGSGSASGGLGGILGGLLGGGSGNQSAGGGLGDILGGILGGANGNQSGSGGLGDVLGSVLGGAGQSQKKSSGGGLGDILGELLGGK